MQVSWHPAFITSCRTSHRSYIIPDYRLCARQA